MSIEKASSFINKKIEKLIEDSTKTLNFQNERNMAENHNVILLDSDMEIEPSTLNRPIIKDTNNDLISGRHMIKQVDISVIKHKEIHTGGNSHNCNVCGKYFKNKSTMDRHYRIHTGEKPVMRGVPF